MADIEEMLPIGSIVLLKNAEKRLMIFGILQSGGVSGKEYDYIGVPYPEGNLGSEYQYVFDQSDISEVSYRGYEDTEHREYRKALNEYCKQRE